MCTTHSEVINVYKGYGRINRLPDVPVFERTLLNGIFLTEIQDVRPHSETTKWSDICFTRLTSLVFPWICTSASQPHFNLSPQLSTITAIQTCIETHGAVSDTEKKIPSRYALHNISALKNVTAASSERRMPSTELHSAVWQGVAILKATPGSISWYNCSLDKINSV